MTPSPFAVIPDPAIHEMRRKLSSGHYNTPMLYCSIGIRLRCS